MSLLCRLLGHLPGVFRSTEPYPFCRRCGDRLADGGEDD